MSPAAPAGTGGETAARGGSRGLMVRVFAANLAVVAVAAVAALLAGLAFAPFLLERHLESMMHATTHGPGFERMAADLEAAYRLALAQSIGWAVAVATVAAAVVAWAVTARLVAPLRALQDASASIAAGRRGGRLDVHAPGEIGQLAATFDRMAEALDEAADVRKRLITDLAHELRTPLSNLRGYVEALEDGVLEFDEDSRAALGRQVDRLERLVADLATLHDLEAGVATIDLARTDLADLVRTGAAAVRTRFGEREVTLTVTAPDEGAWASADPVRTGQVLENLLDNALRFTPSEGGVEVEVSAPNDVVRVEVRDTGPGVPEHERDAVFRRLYRGDRSRAAGTGAGSGVGLTIAKALVERQGGTIGVDDAPSGGARFWFELPSAP